MSTKWALAYAFLLVITLLVAYFVAYLLRTPQEVQTALLLTLTVLLTPLGAMVVRILQNSPSGDVPIRKALDGGVTQHLAENPQDVPQSIKHAVIVAEERKLDAHIGRNMTEAPADEQSHGEDHPAAG